MPSLYPKGTPPALRRCWKWYFLGMGAHMTLMLVGAVALLLAPGVLPMVLAAAAAVGLLVAGVAMSSMATVRIRARVRRLHGQACPNCVYDLSTLPAEGTCPECGVRYTRAEIVRQWRDADRSYQAKKLYRNEEEASGTGH
jgi:hypothetical protein